MNLDAIQEETQDKPVEKVTGSTKRRQHDQCLGQRGWLWRIPE
jgi:hypothetical protein